MLDVRQDKHGVLFWIFVTPRSRRNEIVGIRDGVLRIKVAAAPVEGAANEACLKLLSKALGVSKSSISIRKGETSHRKLIYCRALTSHNLRNTMKNIVND